MKFRVQWKDGDYYAWNPETRESFQFQNEETPEEKKAAELFFKFAGDYVTLEFDTEAGTVTVVKS